jgi:hypothetical protein
MLIESLLLGAGVAVAAAGHRVVEEHRARQVERATAETWFRTIVGSQEIQAKASGARQAMVDEVRRHQGISQYKGGER